MFLFQKGALGTYTFNPQEIALGESMLRYWTRFAITADPTGGPEPLWPTYEVSIDGLL